MVTGCVFGGFAVVLVFLFGPFVLRRILVTFDFDCHDLGTVACCCASGDVYADCVSVVVIDPDVFP